MRRDRFLFAGLLVVVAVCCLWRADLWLFDEPREAELAREMLRSGDHAITFLNGRPFLEKPPLFTAAVALAWRLHGGPSVFLARLVGAAFAAVALVALHGYVRRTLGAAEAWIATGVLATTYRFHDTAHLFVLDNALVGCTTAAIVLLHVAARERRVGMLPFAGVALAATFFAKGLVGLALVGVTIAVDLGLRRDRRALRLLLHPALLAPLALTIVSWIAAIAPEHRSEYLRELLVDNQWGRFSSGYQSHPTDWWFYGPSLAGGLMPWTPLVLWGLVSAVKAAWTSRFPTKDGTGGTRRGSDDVARLALAWTLPGLLMLTLSRARAGIYALPLTPGAALLVALWWRDVTGTPARAPWIRRLLVAAVAILAIASVSATAAATLLGRDAVSIASLALAVTAAGCAWRFRFDGERTMLAAIALAAADCLASQGAFFTDVQRRRLGVDPCASAVASFVGDRPLLLFAPNDAWSGIFGFRGDRTVREVSDWREVEEAARRDPSVALLMSEPVFMRLPEAARARVAPDLSTSCAAETFVVYHVVPEDDNARCRRRGRHHRGIVR